MQIQLKKMLLFILSRVFVLFLLLLLYKSLFHRYDMLILVKKGEQFVRDAYQSFLLASITTNDLKKITLYTKAQTSLECAEHIVDLTKLQSSFSFDLLEFKAILRRNLSTANVELLRV